MPRDFQIAGLKDELQRAKVVAPITSPTGASPVTPDQRDPSATAAIVLVETGLFEGKSATTTDGRLSIKVVQIQGEHVSLSLTVDATAPINYLNRVVGSRVTAYAADVVYYVDIHRVRGNIVDVAVSRHRR